MQGKIDATCSTCGESIVWDTNYPKLCAECFQELMRAVRRKEDARVAALLGARESEAA